ncbi:MAG TPA: PspC domain-containing protein [Acidisarcina sp.]
MAVFCSNCGSQLSDAVRFCGACGAAAPVVGAANPTGTYATGSYPGFRTLIRPRAGRMLGGVCQGIANQYRWDVAWVRFIAVIAALFGAGLGAVGYVVMWVVVPEEPLALPGSVPPYGQTGPPYTPTSGT